MSVPYQLDIGQRLSNHGWVVKIQDRERLEPPHVTIRRKTQRWRYNLREPGFMDSEPPGRKVDGEIIRMIQSNIDLLRNEWDARYPSNPVSPQDDNA